MTFALDRALAALPGLITRSVRSVGTQVGFSFPLASFRCCVLYQLSLLMLKTGVGDASGRGERHPWPHSFAAAVFVGILLLRGGQDATSASVTAMQLKRDVKSGIPRAWY